MNDMVYPSFASESFLQKKLDGSVQDMNNLMTPHAPAWEYKKRCTMYIGS